MEVVIEINFLSILKMTSGCATPNLNMLMWISYIKSMHLELHHIARKNNAMVDMLSRARYEENTWYQKMKLSLSDF